MSYFRIFKKELFFRTAKIGIAALQKNIFLYYLYCGVYKVLLGTFTSGRPL